MPHNPFAGWRVSNDWAGHMSYSAGGTDYPLGYGVALPAPAAGTLYTAGQAGGYRGGEFTCGWVGSAGRRSILILDSPIRDVVAVVFQHQSKFGLNATWYAEGKTVGWSGASANQKDWGGDVHLHIHCLTASGARRDFTRYFAGTRPAAIEVRPLEQETEMSIQSRNGMLWFVDEFGADQIADFVSTDMGNSELVGALSAVFGAYEDHGPRAFDLAAAIAQRRWARKLGEIAKAVAVATNPTISRELLDLAVKRALPEGALSFELDDAAAGRVAKAVQDEQDRRDRERLGDA